MVIFFYCFFAQLKPPFIFCMSRSCFFFLFFMMAWACLNYCVFLNVLLNCFFPIILGKKIWQQLGSGKVNTFVISEEIGKTFSHCCVEFLSFEKWINDLLPENNFNSIKFLTFVWLDSNEWFDRFLQWGLWFTFLPDVPIFHFSFYRICIEITYHIDNYIVRW